MDKSSTNKSISGTLFTQEVTDNQVESFKKAKQAFQENEKKILNQQIQDLQMTLEINKGIICDLLQCKSLSHVETAIVKKFNDENDVLKFRIKSIYHELDESNAQVLLLQQICNELQAKESENAQLYEEQLNELKDKLERKEYFMQTKERKWLEVEKILEEYAEEDDELREKLYDLRINVFSNKKISNVVEENEKLKLQLDQVHEEIGRLRKQILLMGFGVGKNRKLQRKEGGMHSPKLINDKKREIVEVLDLGEGDEEEEDYEDQDQSELEGDDCTDDEQYNNENCRYSTVQNHKTKKAFMSTAPINFQSNFGGPPKPNKLKIKESKQELKQYSHQLEEALAKIRQKYIEIEKDHEILNKTYMKQLKQGDSMQKALNKVKGYVQQLAVNDGKLCGKCLCIQEVIELKKIIRERVFDVSNEGENTIDQLELSFNKEENWKSKTKVIQTRGQNNTAVARSRQSQNTSQRKQQTTPFQKIRDNDLNRLSNIIPEEELDIDGQFKDKSPYLNGILNSNLVSAIGIADSRKDSPFWDQEHMYELNSQVKGYQQQLGQGGNQNRNQRGRLDPEINDQFRS